MDNASEEARRGRPDESGLVEVSGENAVSVGERSQELSIQHTPDLDNLAVVGRDRVTVSQEILLVGRKDRSSNVGVLKPSLITKLLSAPNRNSGRVISQQVRTGRGEFDIQVTPFLPALLLAGTAIVELGVRVEGIDPRNLSLVVEPGQELLHAGLLHEPVALVRAVDDLQLGLARFGVS